MAFKGVDVSSLFVRVAPALACAVALLIHEILPDRQSLLVDPLESWLDCYPVLLGIFLALSLIMAAAAWIAPPMRSWVREYAPLMAGALIAIALWDLVTLKMNWMVLPYFPGPNRVLASLIRDRGVLLQSAGHSLVLLLSGYVFGVAAGLVAGVSIGWFPRVRYWGMPILKVVGPIPATALIPLVMTLSNDSFFPATALIGFAVWFPVTMLTSSGIANVRLAHLEVARTLGASERFLIFRVAVPSALPNIFVGLFMGLGASFLTLIVAETVGVQAGLGYYLKNQQGSMAYANMYGALIIMAAFFSGLMTLLFKLRDWMLQWQQGVIKW